MTPSTHPEGAHPPRVELVDPGPGRVYTSRRRVRLSDVDPSGRLRLDAVARYLQDVAADDVRDAGVEDAVVWVVRRTTVLAPTRPVYGEEVALATWCSGTGAAWAERRTTIRGDRGSNIETVALWVSLDRAGKRPVPLTGSFFAPYRQAAGARKVRPGLRLPSPPGSADRRRPWPLRRSDLDVLGHVNNAVAWTAAEDEALQIAPGASFVWGEVEYRQPIEAGDTPTVTARRDADVVWVWLLDAEGSATTTARLGTAGP